MIQYLQRLVYLYDACVLGRQIDKNWTTIPPYVSHEKIVNSTIKYTYIC